MGTPEEETEQRLAAIVESSDDAIYSFTLDGRILSWNKSAERIYGYTEAEAFEMSLFDFAPPGRPDEVAAVLERVRLGGRVETFETERISKGGRRVEVALNVSPIRSDEGDVVAASTIARDISDRRRTERYLAAQHGATRVVAGSPAVAEVGGEILPILAEAGRWLGAAYWAVGRGGSELRCDAVWTTPRVSVPSLPDREGTTHEAYEGGTKLLWLCEPDEAIGLPGDERADFALRTQAWVPILARGELFGAFHFLDRRARERDDELVMILSTVAAQVGGYLERTLAEQEAQRSKDEFFALVSHELQTPLTSIIGYSELLVEVESERLSERGREFVEAVHRNAEREMRLVGALLLLVRIKEGAFVINRQKADLQQIVEHAVQAHRPAAHSRGVALSMEADHAPPVEADVHRIAQVVDNLLSNAVKFTPQGGRVTVRLIARDATTLIEVEDTGVGIPDEEQERVFERLYRAPSAAAAQIPGLGLGLTIVRAIVEAHGGAVGLESREGIGTRLRVELPIRPPASSHTDDA